MSSISNRMVTVSHIEKVTFNQKPEVGEQVRLVAPGRKRIPSRRGNLS